MTPISVAEFDEKDLGRLAKLHRLGYDAKTAEELLEAVAHGRYTAWRTVGGIVITAETATEFWVEGIAGENLLVNAARLLGEIREAAGSRPVRFSVNSSILEKFYERRGAKRVAVVMEV